jgi:hypothetical protein
MKKYLGIIALVILLPLLMAKTALADSTTIIHPGNNHSYQLIDAEKTWRDAKIYCENHGGYLATLTSQEENDFVYDRVAEDEKSIWLGGTDRNVEGKWEWITGETWDYENWARHPIAQPDNSRDGQDYLAFWSIQSSKWDDAGLPVENKQFPFICEWNDSSGADDPTSVAWEKGRKQGQQECIDDPATCGITVNPTCVETESSCISPIGTKAHLSFSTLEPLYNVGDSLKIDLVEMLQDVNRFDRADLWVIIQLPDGSLLFMTPLALGQFSPKPQPFRESLDSSQTSHRVLEFEVIPGLGGNYTFYAVYVKEGKNPMTDSFLVLRSNVATVNVVLSNR